MNHRRYVAFDVDAMLNIERGDNETVKSLDLLTSVGFFPLVTPTVLQGLSDLMDGSGEISTLAENVLRYLTQLGFIAPPLERLDHGIAQIVGRRILALGTTSPTELDEDDGLIIAEAAIQGCDVLLTDQEPILMIPNRELSLILASTNLTRVIPVRASQFESEWQRGRIP